VQTVIAARVAGFMYLFLLVTAGVAEFGLRTHRAGVALDLLAAPGVMLLAVALYALLRPVHPHLALLAMLWRAGESILLASIAPLALTTADTFPDEAFTGAHEYGYAVGLVFFALGSAVFGYLLLRSGIVPRWLAALGIAAPLVVLASLYTIIVSPDAERFLLPAVYAPIGLFELTLGVWLLARPPAAAS